MIGMFRRQQVYRLAAAVCILMLAMSVMGFSQPPRTVLHNGDIINLKKAGVDDEIIVLMIRGSATEFSNAPSDVIALKEGGVSNYLMSVMLKTQPTPAAVEARFVATSTRSDRPDGNTISDEVQFPRAEIFTGFSLTHPESVKSPGGNVSIGVNFNNVFGIVGEVTGASMGASRVSARGYDVSVRGGPKFSIRTNRWITPFVQALVGGSHGRATGSSSKISTNGISAGAGGGVDIRVFSHLAIRAIQAEYNVVHLSGLSGTAGALGLSFGTVFGF